MLKLSLNNGCGHIHHVGTYTHVPLYAVYQFTRQSPHKPIASPPPHDCGEFLCMITDQKLYSVEIVLFTWYTPSCLISTLCVYTCNCLPHHVPSKACPVYTCLPWYTPSCMHACMQSAGTYMYIHDSNIVLALLPAGIRTCHYFTYSARTRGTPASARRATHALLKITRV